jgi:hypothetical protein
MVPLAGNRLILQAIEFEAIFAADSCRYQQNYQHADAQYWLAKK